ncbi:hypothetical protein GPALN_010661 [Globodera pallida]|nr:hypothetical protein GPALN_010661 [Globodera pallida]
MDNYYPVCGSPPPYQWNLTNSGDNVQIFAQFIDDIYQQSQPIYKLSFNLTFVKYASEFANFRVIEHSNENMCQTFNVRTDAYTEAGITANKSIIPVNQQSASLLSGESTIGESASASRPSASRRRRVDHRRVGVGESTIGESASASRPSESRRRRVGVGESTIGESASASRPSASRRRRVGVGESTIGESASASRPSASRRRRVDHRRVGVGESTIGESASASRPSASRPSASRRRRVDHRRVGVGESTIGESTIGESASASRPSAKNFNFVLKLSEFSLSYYEVYKVLEAILNESNAAVSASNNNNNHLPTNDEPPQPAVHTFLKQYFIAKLGSKSMEQYNVNKVDCAFVRFGRELERRFVEHASPIRYPGFSEYVKRMEAECGKAPWITRTKNTLYWKRSCFTICCRIE